MKLSKNRPHSGMSFNMTPMIDIVFLLIIFFMTVSQITQVTDHPVALPRVSEGEALHQTATVTINLDKEGEIIVGGVKLTEEKLLSAIKSQLEKVQFDPDRIKIQIRCDRNCESKHVSKLLEKLSGLGFKQVRAAVTAS